MAGPSLRAAPLFPELKAQSLDKVEHRLPQELRGRPAVLVFGFTKASSAPCADWQKRLWLDAELNTRAAVLGIAQLETVPGWVLPLVLRALRRGMPESHHGRFLVLLSDRAAWQRCLGWNSAAADDPYLVLLDADGGLAWQAHGPLAPSLESELRSRLARLLLAP